jgi:3-dehydroquinate synthase
LRQAGFGPVPVATFEAGEAYKTLDTVINLCNALYEIAPPLDRKTLLIALGGGVVGDVAGFVAGIYLRGLDYIQIPTTLLAMVDSSVGGKTGVDLKSGKNLVGVFHQPKAVLIDPDVLQTLPQAETNAGLAEVIKYGVIADPPLFAPLAQFATASGAEKANALSVLVARSCEIKANVVAQDELEETGLRATLNFGHTVGHALESATEYTRFRHGEAVAMGMMAACYIGEAHGTTRPNVTQTVQTALKLHQLPTHIPADLPAPMLLPLLGRDKKAQNGRARWILAQDVGHVALFDDVSDQTVQAGLARAYAKAEDNQ